MLHDTSSKLDSMRGIASTARMNIQSMKDKVFRHKLCLWIVMIGLLLTNIAVIITLARNDGHLLPQKTGSDDDDIAANDNGN